VSTGRVIEITNGGYEPGIDLRSAGISEKARPVSSDSPRSLDDADLGLMLSFFELLAKWEQRGNHDN
jgi:hypothetical protein